MTSPLREPSGALTESLVCRVVHNGDEQVTRYECRWFIRFSGQQPSKREGPVNEFLGDCALAEMTDLEVARRSQFSPTAE